MTNSQPSDNRRSTRLSLSLPIVIHGKDFQQNTFRESSHTLIVNQHGAKILTAQQLVVGAEVLVENPTLGSVAKANIVWVSPKRNPSGLFEVGIQLLESQNIWGLEFPPEDWTPAGKAQEAPAAKATAAPRPAPAKSKPAQAPSGATSSEQIATQFLQELHETTDAHARKFQERLDQVVQRIGRQWEMDLRERAGAAKEQELAAIEQQVLVTSEQLSTLKAELEDLNVRLGESQRSILAAQESVPLLLTSEHIQEKIQEAALPALHRIAEGGIASGRERFQAQVQEDAGQALAAWRSNLESERDSLLEEARQQIVTAVTRALAELNQQSDTGVKEMTRRIEEEIGGNQDKFVLQIKSKLDETLESHSESLVARLNETVRKTGERQTNMLQTQLDALLVNHLEQAQRQAKSMGESLQSSVEDGLRALGEKARGNYRRTCRKLPTKPLPHPQSRCESKWRIPPAQWRRKTFSNGKPG